MDTKRTRLLAVVLLALSLSFNGDYVYAKAVEIDLSKPDQSEVLEKVSKFTGLTKDVVELVNEEHAELFKGLDNTVFAYKVFNLITEAKDSQALTEVTMKTLEIVKDLLVKEAFPAAVGTFFTVASVYKTSLELVRDYKWIPGYEEKIYRLYKKQRDTAPNAEGPEVWETAFWMGTGVVPGEGLQGLKDAGGYYVVKGKMLDEMVKEKLKLKSQEEAGPQALKIFNKQVDDFWISRMEMRYQKERMKTRKAEIVKELWEKKAQQLEAIKAAAAKVAGPQRFFLTEKDIPQGWKREIGELRDDQFTPKDFSKHRGANEWYQQVCLYKAEYTQKYIPEGKTYKFLTSDGKPVDINLIVGSISIGPRIWTGPVGDIFDHLDDLEDLPANRKQFLPEHNVLGEFRDEGALLGYVEQAEYPKSHSVWYYLHFVKGSWYVRIEMASDNLFSIQKSEAMEIERTKGKPYYVYDKTVASEGLIRTLGQIVARKIPAGKPEPKEAKKK